MKILCIPKPAICRFAMVIGIACAIAHPSPSRGGSKAPPATDSARPVHWSYESADGPGQWAALSPAYAACGSGKAQSPIDLPSAGAPATADSPRFAYKPSALRMSHHENVDDIIDNGHTIQVTVEDGSTLTSAKDTYELKQFHFHTPSEHTLAGKQFPLEIHFVHQSAAGNLAVVGVLVAEGSDHAELGKLLDHLPANVGDTVHRPEIVLDPAAHLPAEAPTLTYDGSLTTPPCSEGVEWFVRRQPITAGKAQIAKLAARLKRNNRPVQPSNGRDVKAQKLAQAVLP